MSSDDTNEFFSAKPQEVAIGRVMLTPEGPKPYKAIFRVGDRVLAEHPVATVREGEALIRRELPGIQFSAIDQGHHPKAPKRRLSSVAKDATD